MDLAQAYLAHLSRFDDPRVGNDLAEALVAAGERTESALLRHYLEHGASSTLVREPTSPFLGHRAWVGTMLPDDAAAGDLWYDPIEAMPMILVPAEPHPTPLSQDTRFPPLVAWLACRPVARWQYCGYALAAGRGASVDPALGPATGVPFEEAREYASWFGKVLSDHIVWQAATHLLSPLLLEDMWQGLPNEWSGLRSERERSLALIIPADGLTEDPEDALDTDRFARGGEARRRFTREPAGHDHTVGLRTVVTIQFGLGTEAKGRLGA